MNPAKSRYERLTTTPAWRRAVAVCALPALIAACCAVLPRPTPTEAYLRRLDLETFCKRGAGYTSRDASPHRLGRPLHQLDNQRDFDYAQLAEAEQRLCGVHRRRALAAIFARLTQGAASDTERHLRVLHFLQHTIRHPFLPPRHPAPELGKRVSDPLVLLELGQGWCGQVSRLAVDLFAAGGYNGRLVQLGGHVIAEVHYGGRWHFVDADLFKGGQVVLNADGTVPSVAELERDPHRIDALASYHTPNFRNNLPASSGCYPSYYFFSRSAYCLRDGQPHLRYVHRKVGNSEKHQQSRHFGWEELIAEPIVDACLIDAEPCYYPGAPALEDVQVHRGPAGRLTVRLAWAASEDPDGDLLGYRVYVGRASRGWNYDGPSVPADLMAFKSGHRPWDGSMYERRFTLPPADVALHQTDGPALEFEVDATGDYYISVLPFDAHGERAGRRLYPMSEEIVIRAERP